MQAWPTLVRTSPALGTRGDDGGTAVSLCSAGPRASVVIRYDELIATHRERTDATALPPLRALGAARTPPSHPKSKLTFCWAMEADIEFLHTIVDECNFVVRHESIERSNVSFVGESADLLF